MSRSFLLPLRRLLALGLATAEGPPGFLERAYEADHNFTRPVEEDPTLPKLFLFAAAPYVCPWARHSQKTLTVLEQELNEPVPTAEAA